MVDPASPVTSVKPIRIFILDENPSQASFMRYHLKGNGFRYVQSYTSATDCLYTIRKDNHPDFIIIDPGHSSSAFLEFMQVVIGINPMIRFIIFSANGDEFVMNRFLLAGAKDYIHRGENSGRHLSELVSNIRYLLNATE